jgi:hypothetical protein
MLGPIKNQDPRINSVDELCKSFSAIPFKNKTMPESDLTAQLRKLETYQNEPSGFDSLNSYQSAAWTLASPPNFLSENFFAQMSSPSSMIARREGSLLEHTMGLCSMLLAAGENAYVAIGNVKKRCYIWVIIVKTTAEEDQKLKQKKLLPYMEEDDYDVNTDALYIYKSFESQESFNVKDFDRFDRTKSIREVNNGLTIVHCDAASGKCFQHSLKKTCPFDRISTLFNHRNIWYNTQHTDLISQ